MASVLMVTGPLMPFCFKEMSPSIFSPKDFFKEIRIVFMKMFVYKDIRRLRQI